MKADNETILTESIARRERLVKALADTTEPFQWSGRKGMVEYRNRQIRQNHKKRLRRTARNLKRLDVVIAKYSVICAK